MFIRKTVADTGPVGCYVLFVKKKILERNRVSPKEIIRKLPGG